MDDGGRGVMMIQATSQEAERLRTKTVQWVDRMNEYVKEREASGDAFRDRHVIDQSMMALQTGIQMLGS